MAEKAVSGKFFRKMKKEGRNPLDKPQNMV